MAIYSELSDVELLSLVKENNQIAYTEIFNRYNKLLYSHTYNKLRNEAESRDVVQDVFINLWEKRQSVNDTNLGGYLFTMIRNRIINLVSHQKIVIDYLEIVKKSNRIDYSTTDHLIRDKQLAAIIEAEIEASPSRMREIFKMSRREYLTNKEIAQKLNLSEHTVADQIKKSLRILRIKIGLALLIAYFLGN